MMPIAANNLSLLYSAVPMNIPRMKNDPHSIRPMLGRGNDAPSHYRLRQRSPIGWKPKVKCSLVLNRKYPAAQVDRCWETEHLQEPQIFKRLTSLILWKIKTPHYRTTDSRLLWWGITNRTSLWRNFFEQFTKSQLGRQPSIHCGTIDYFPSTSRIIRPKKAKLKTMY